MNGIQSSQQDYQYALEGVGYAQQVIKGRMAEMDQVMVDLNNPEVMGGETGKEYCKRLQEAVSVVQAVVTRYNAFADKVAQVCKENGAFLDNTVMDDFNEVQKRFAVKVEEISKVNGSQKAAR